MACTAGVNEIWLPAVIVPDMATTLHCWRPTDAKVLLQADSTIIAARAALSVCPGQEAICEMLHKGRNDSLFEAATSKQSAQVAWYLNHGKVCLAMQPCLGKQQLQVWLCSKMRTSAWQDRGAFQDSSCTARGFMMAAAGPGM